MNALQELAHDLNAEDIISDDDLDRYLNVIMDALAIHVDRENIRHGLWKEYPARDQMAQVKIKIERGLRSVGMATLQQDEAAVEELLDIINYSVFAVRLLRGEMA